MPGREVVRLAPASPPAVPLMPWDQQPAQVREFALVPAARWVRKNNHVSVPLFLPAALWLAGLGLHLGRALPYAVACGGLLAACVWFFAPHKWDRPAEQWYARLSALLGAGWLALAAWLGPLSGVAGIVLASLLAAGCTVWGFFWWRHKRPRGQRRQDALTAQCDAWWQSHCARWNLHGSHVVDAELRDVTLRIRVHGIPGLHTQQHFRQVLPFIESAAEGQADVGLVRIAGVKGKPSEVDIYLKQQNPLRETVEYDLELAPRSVHDPAPQGRKESGGWKMVPQRVNKFAIGKTRSGKSNDLLVALANLSGCLDARAVIIDLKGGRSARPVLASGAAEYVIIDRDEARMYLRMMTAEAKARQMYAYDGNEQLLASREVPAWFTMVDETYELTATENGAGDAESRRHMATLAAQGSGVEEYLWVYTQHGSLETSVGTEQIRGNLSMRVCYAVAEARHGAYCIPEYNVLDASKLEEKGTCYVKDGPEVTPEQVRAPKMDHALFVTVAAQNTALLGDRGPVRLYCGGQAAYDGPDGPVSWQQWWDERWLRLPAPFRDGSPQYQAAAAVYGQPAETSPPVTGIPSPAAAGPERGREPSLLDAPGFRPDPRLVAQLPAVIASQEERFAARLQAADYGSPVSPKELIAASGRGRSWVHDRLAALVEIQVIAQVTRGLYYTLPGQDVRQGLERVAAETARVTARARELINAV